MAGFFDEKDNIIFMSLDRLHSGPHYNEYTFLLKLLACKAQFGTEYPAALMLLNENFEMVGSSEYGWKQLRWLKAVEMVGSS